MATSSVRHASPAAIGGWVLLISIGCYAALPIAVFRASCWGGAPSVVAIYCLAILALLALLRFALWPRPGLRRVVVAAALAALQVAAFPLVVALGNRVFTWDVTNRLPEYESIVSRAKAELAAHGSDRVTFRDPHPDIAFVDAHQDRSGGLVVRLVFSHSRAVQLFFVSGHELPFKDDHLCLVQLADHWQWYKPCA